MESPDEDDYLDVCFGRIQHLTKDGGKKGKEMVDVAAFDDEDLTFRLAWFERFLEEPSRQRKNSKKFILPLTCDDGYNRQVDNSDDSKGIVLGKVEEASMPCQNGVYTLDPAVEQDLNAKAMKRATESWELVFSRIGKE